MHDVKTAKNLHSLKKIKILTTVLVFLSSWIGTHYTISLVKAVQQW